MSGTERITSTYLLSGLGTKMYTILMNLMAPSISGAIIKEKWSATSNQSRQL